MTRYHINKHGIPALCKAKPGNCPLRETEGDKKEVPHFNTPQEAQAYIDKKNENKYGLLPKQDAIEEKPKKESKKKVESIKKDEGKANKSNELTTNKVYREATSDDTKYLKERKKFLHNESTLETYIQICRSCKRIDDYKPKDKQTYHNAVERKNKTDNLTRMYGEGNNVGFYEVDHLMYNKEKGKREYKKQVVGILDNGRISIYDFHTGREVTNFMGHRARIEAMMLLSNEIPNEDFMKKVNSNYNKEKSYQKMIKLKREARKKKNKKKDGVKK